MARNALTSGSRTADATSYQTAEIAPSANSLVVLFVTSSTAGPFGGTPAPVPTATGTALTWTVVATVPLGTTRRLTCLRALGSGPRPGAVTIDFGNAKQDYCAWSVVEYTGVDTNGPIRQPVTDTVNGSSVTVTLSTSLNPAGNVKVGAIALDLNNEPDRTVTPGAGFTEIHEENPDQLLGRGTSLQTQDGPAALTAMSWTWSAARGAAVIAFEVAAPTPVTPPSPPPSEPLERLVQRFAPVLFLHPSEKYVPVDAKRFIEHSALWTAGDPNDDTASWTELVAVDKLAAASNEGGEYRFDDSPGALGDRRFLQFGGWKDAAGDPVTDPVPSPNNRYSDRASIANRYLAEPELEASRFWYHAEVYDKDRLKSAAARAFPLDVGKYIDSLTDPRLLCYYLLFPAHEQSVGAGECTSVTASEVASHAADWQAITILLDGDGAGTPESFTPEYFGITGSRPEPEADVYPPHDFDGDERTVLKVQKWADNAPEVTQEHPRFYVANGSHSLYTDPGEHAVDPYPGPLAPSQCGALDGPQAAIPGDVRETGWIAAAVVAKLLTPALVPGGLLTSLGAIVVEALNSGSFGTEGSAATPPDPDVAPAAAGRGITIHPAGLEVPDAGANTVAWRSARDVTIGTRKYDFIVDRDTQKWWPHDDGEQGFRGRWGQHVASDSLSRRAGPRFPDYAVMFLRALADLGPR